MFRTFALVRPADCRRTAARAKALDSHIVPLSKRQRYEMARLGTLCVWCGEEKLLGTPCVYAGDFQDRGKEIVCRLYFLRIAGRV